MAGVLSKISALEGVEGVVLRFADGRMFKVRPLLLFAGGFIAGSRMLCGVCVFVDLQIKTEWYVSLSSVPIGGKASIQDVSPMIEPD